jgi:hypothetical protein
MPDPNPNPAPPAAGTPGAGTPATPAVPNGGAPPANGGTPANPTLLNGEPPKGVEPAAPSAWGDDWREKYANTDEKRLNVLKRYASPKDVLDAHFALKQRVDSGELKAVKALPANATPEQIAAYRAENGIPANAGDYLANLPNGLVIGEADKPALTNFAEAMHKANMPPAVVHQAIGWYNAWQEQQAADIAKAEREGKQRGEDQLRADWGADYRTNLNLANDFLTNTAGDELADQLATAVLPDGTVLGDNPQVLQWLAKVAREVNPVATLVPPGGGPDQLAGRKAEIEKTMRTNRDAYNRDEAMQAEYRRIIEAEQRINTRKAG